jgi:uncharacterized protein
VTVDESDFDRYTLVFLRRTDGAPSLTDAEAADLQARHLAFLDEMVAAGRMVVAGPIEDEDDTSLRGICVYACGHEEASRWAATDPWVLAGRLRPDAVTWWTKKDAIAHGLTQVRGAAS